MSVFFLVGWMVFRDLGEALAFHKKHPNFRIRGSLQ